MLVRAASQGKREFCIALFNRELNKNACCPANYDVGYECGWFTSQYGAKEPQKQQRPELTAEADQMMKNGTHEVYYSTSWNTYFIGEIPQDYNEEEEDE